MACLFYQIVTWFLLLTIKYPNELIIVKFWMVLYDKFSSSKTGALKLCRALSTRQIQRGRQRRRESQARRSLPKLLRSTGQTGNLHFWILWSKVINECAWQFFSTWRWRSHPLPRCGWRTAADFQVFGCGLHWPALTETVWHNYLILGFLNTIVGTVAPVLPD